jgi:hypothetical protein
MRIADLAKRYDELNAQGGALAEAAEPPPFVPAPTPVHEELGGMLTRLIELGVSTNNGQAPPHIRALLRTLHGLQPMFIEELAAVPEPKVRHFLTEMRDSLDRVLSAPSGPPSPPAS